MHLAYSDLFKNDFVSQNIYHPNTSIAIQFKNKLDYGELSELFQVVDISPEPERPVENVPLGSIIPVTLTAFLIIFLIVFYLRKYERLIFKFKLISSLILLIQKNGEKWGKKTSNKNRNESV